MRARLTAVLLVPLALLYIVLGVAYGRSDAQSLQLETYLDRLSDTTQLVVSARQALGVDDPVTMRSELDRYHEVYGIGALLLNSSGEVIVANELSLDSMTSTGRSEVDAALAGRSSGPPADLEVFGGPLVVAEPVFESGDLVGAVVTASDTSGLATQVLQRWAVLVGIGIVALVGSLVIVSRLAKWVLNPLRMVDSAMTEMLHGNIDTRISTTSGPPELQRVITQFNGMAKEVERLIGQQQDFVANAAHELRNPLNALLLRVEHLGLGLDDDWQDEVDLTREEGQRMAKILDALLVLSRGEGDTNIAPVEIAVMVRRRAHAWEYLASEQGKRVKVTTDGQAWGRVDETMLESAFDAVLDNALKFSPDGAAIRVAVHVEDHNVCIVVLDGGPGMSAEEITQATGRFWRSPQHQNVQGSGLGLAIATEFLKASGGGLELATADEGGLMVSMRIPRTTPPAGLSELDDDGRKLRPGKRERLEA